ncbi:MAG: hypothetical protein SOV83_03185 [Prevotella sp.]|nr:hypothetical protein [Prevotella sp.]
MKKLTACTDGKPKAHKTLPVEEKTYERWEFIPDISTTFSRSSDYSLYGNMKKPSTKEGMPIAAFPLLHGSSDKLSGKIDKSADHQTKPTRNPMADWG